MYLALISQKIWELMVVLVSRNAILPLKDYVFSIQLKLNIAISLYLHGYIYIIVWCICSISHKTGWGDVWAVADTMDEI